MALRDARTDPLHHPMRRSLIAVATLLLQAAPVPAQEGATAENVATFLTAARTAWEYVDRQYQPSTGLINSVAGYTFATVWDIGSGLAALFSARELGLLSPEEYDRRMSRALRTLQEVKLFDGIAFNKNYSTRTGRIAGRNDRDAAGERGYGWSSTDIGRLLIWLRIVAENHPAYAADAARVVERMSLLQIVKDGYLWGGSLGRRGQLNRYIEGRIPYEQYAATGFALWGHEAEHALGLTENALPIEVLEVPLVADRRGHDHLTSEPLVLMGLETGWTPEMAALAANVLRAQAERHRRTGQVTMVSEDAIPQAPYYFFYYTLNFHGRQFAVVTQSPERVLDEPRWISAKAAYGWHALLGDAYTRLAVEAVAGARHAGRGWSSGVYEGSGRSTGSENINTAAVILEAALYHQRGRPLIEPRSSLPPADQEPG